MKLFHSWVEIHSFPAFYATVRSCHRDILCYIATQIQINFDLLADKNNQEVHEEDSTWVNHKENSWNLIFVQCHFVPVMFWIRSL